MNFKDFTKLVEENISDYPNFEITKKGSNFIWIGIKDSKVGNWSCHYEFIYNSEILNADLHFEHYHKNSFMEVIGNAYPAIPRHNKGVRLNKSNLKLSNESITECFNLFSEVNKKFGIALNKIEDQIHNELISKIIDSYTYLLTTDNNKALKEELYKWDLIKKCKNKSSWEIFLNLKNSNLVFTSSYNIVCNSLAKEYEIETNELLNNLFDENQSLDVRLTDYKNRIADLSKKAGCKVSISDERTAISLLTCKYPEKYTFFMPSAYNKLISFFDEKEKGNYERIIQFYTILDEISEKIFENTTLLNMIAESFSGYELYKKLIAQTVIWTSFYVIENQGEVKMANDTLTEECKDLLLNTHNLILHGAPGTGKTHLANKIIENLNAEKGFVQFHPSFDYTDFVEGLRPVHDLNNNVIFERKDGIFKKFCKEALINLINSKKDIKEVETEISNKEIIDNFLANSVAEQKEFSIKIGTPFYIKSYDESHIQTVYKKDDKLIDVEPIKYSDILTLLNENKEIQRMDVKNYVHRKVERQADSYSSVIVNTIRKEGIKTRIHESINNSEKNYVFIIDEINRGELSKIFGELFFNIDPGYRGPKGKINTQYQNLIDEDDLFFDGFYIPENVYIIGTMNDIDRSVESMDFAFRRRFAFKEITAANTQEEILNELDENTKKESLKRLISLNNCIDNIEGLSSAYHIGGAYFLKLKELNNSFDLLWKYHLEGLLREYLRGTEDTEENLEKLHKAYNLSSGDNS